MCGENLYATHSIHYTNLPSWFMVFSIWNEQNVSLSWADTVAFADLLGLEMVPTLYHGQWDEKQIRCLYHNEYESDPCEGYVVRVTREFMYSEFTRVVCKFVRHSHITTSDHWRHEPIVPNALSPDALNSSRKIKS